MRTIYLSILTICFGFCTAQNFATTSDKSKGYYKIAANETDKTMAQTKSRVTFKFIGPTGKPVKSNVKFVFNNDSLFPKIEENGNFSMNLVPGKYKMRFDAPFWNSVRMDSTLFRKQGYMSILVKFEAKSY